MPDLRLLLNEVAGLSLGEYLGAPSNQIALNELTDLLRDVSGPARFDGEDAVILPMTTLTEDIANEVVRRVDRFLGDPGIEGLLEWEVLSDDDENEYQYMALVIEEDGPDTGCEVFGPFRDQSEAKAFADRAAQELFDAYEENRINMGPHQGWGIRIGVGPNPDLGMTPEQQLEKALSKIEERAAFLYGVEK